MPILKMAIISFVVTTLISALIFLPGIVATGAIPLVTMAYFCPSFFVSITTYLSLLNACDNDCFQQKLLLNKLGLFAKPTEKASKNVIKAMQDDIRMESQKPSPVIDAPIDDRIDAPSMQLSPS
jgi:hypothetical protein